MASFVDPDSGSGAFFTPGSGIREKSGSGSGMNNPDHISESLKNNGLIYINSLMRIRDPVPFSHLDPRSGMCKNQDPGPG